MEGPTSLRLAVEGEWVLFPDCLSPGLFVVKRAWKLGLCPPLRQPGRPSRPAPGDHLYERGGISLLLFLSTFLLCSVSFLLLFLNVFPLCLCPSVWISCLCPFPCPVFCHRLTLPFYASLFFLFLTWPFR